MADEKTGGKNNAEHRILEFQQRQIGLLTTIMILLIRFSRQTSAYRGCKLLIRFSGALTCLQQKTYEVFKTS